MKIVLASLASAGSLDSDMTFLSPLPAHPPPYNATTPAPPLDTVHWGTCSLSDLMEHVSRVRSHSASPSHAAATCAPAAYGIVIVFDGAWHTTAPEEFCSACRVPSNAAQGRLPGGPDHAGRRGDALATTIALVVHHIINGIRTACTTHEER